MWSPFNVRCKSSLDFRSRVHFTQLQEKLALLFDDDGHIITGSCWTEKDFQNKTGVFIEKLEVADQYKGQVEPWLLPKIFHLEAAESVSLIIIEIPEQMLVEAEWLRDVSLISFSAHLFTCWQVGFRRVAHSEFFALAKDPKHPSHTVVPHEDSTFKTQPVPIPGWATYRTPQNLTM